MILGIEKNLGYVFKNKELLFKTFRHKSYAHENKLESNEILEFLGDSILEFIMTEHLYKLLPDSQEGKLTKIRAFIVCEDSLFEVAQKLEFDKFILLGKSQLKAGGVAKPLLADMVEAVIAAIYLDSDISVTRKIVLEMLEEKIHEALNLEHLKDYKTILQETIQENQKERLIYEIIGEKGPDHEKEFTVQLIIGNEKVAIGVGKSKKEAQTQAARNALIKMKIITEDE